MTVLAPDLVQKYLEEQNVHVILKEALSELYKAKPSTDRQELLAWIASYIREHNPNIPVIGDVE
jgi:hypothetical protein